MLDRFELLDEISDFFSYRDAALIKHGKSLFESSSEIGFYFNSKRISLFAVAIL